MIVISSREFRQNQRLYFEKADKRERIIVQRGKDKSYVLTSVDKNDLYFNDQMVKRINESLKQADNGEYTELNSAEDIKNLLGL